MVLGHQLLWIHISTNIRAGHELDPFGSHQVQSALNVPLVEFHVRNPVSEQSAYSVGPFINGDQVPDLVELIGCS